MFPFAGAQATAAEARTFYDFFDPNRQPTFTSITSPLAFITGPGKHANLRPVLPRILKFFMDALQPSPFPPVYDDQSPAVQPPPGAFQVTSTGQVSTFDTRAETVFSLNLAHAATLPRPTPKTLISLQQSIRQVTGLSASPDQHEHTRHAHPPANNTQAPDPEPWRSSAFAVKASPLPDTPVSKAWQVDLPRPDGPDGPTLAAILTVPNPMPAFPTLVLLLRTSLRDQPNQPDRVSQLVASGHVVLTLSPQPQNPGQILGQIPGQADTKSPLLGPWYLPALRSMLVGRTLLGQRVADTLLAFNYLGGLRLPHTPGFQAEASGHLALVLLHAAVLDLDPSFAGLPEAPPARLRHADLEDLPPTYAQLLANPRPQDASEDILPGVLLYYDLPDLLAALGGQDSKIEPDNPPLWPTSK